MQTMNLVDKLMQQSVLDRIDENDFEEKVIAPYVVELDPTGVCDLACPGCISEDFVSRGNSFSNERLLELGQEMIDSGVKAVILIGGGEPLAHPSAGNLITLLGRNDVHVGITTNGSFVDRYLPAISEYSHWTRFSMDAGTDETFRILRPSKGGKSKFKKILNNMEMLAKIKRGKLGYSFLIQTEADGIPMQSNCHEIFIAAKLARDLGCDYFEIKPTYAFRDDQPHALQKHDTKYMDQALEQIMRLPELEDDNFKILKAINLEASLTGIQETQEKRYSNCPSTYLRTTITSEGSYVCPYWRGKKDFFTGDCNKNSFSSVMSGSLRQRVNRNLDAKSTCAFHCLRNDTNHEILRLKGATTLEGIKEFDRFI